MKVGTLHHVSLPVRDLEGSKRFYREVLGLGRSRGRPSRSRGPGSASATASCT